MHEKMINGKDLKENNPTVPLIGLHLKEKEICPAYISKINSNCEIHITILLMTPQEEKERWHYVAVNKLPALLRWKKSKHKNNFCCLNCLHSFATKNKLESHEKVCKKKYICGIILRTQNNNLIQFNQYMKRDLEFLIHWIFDLKK